MTNRFQCPRRDKPSLRDDRWEKGHGLVHQKNELSCSHCGSLHPDTFMELTRDGWILTPTDKNYKVYAEQPLSDEEKERRRLAWRKGWRPVAFSACQNSIPKPTPEDVEAELARMWVSVGQPLVWGIGGELQYKFYFQHLSVAQRREFVTLYNNDALTIGYPGYFYTLPFFCTEASPYHDDDTVRDCDVAQLSAPLDAPPGSGLSR